MKSKIALLLGSLLIGWSAHQAAACDVDNPPRLFALAMSPPALAPGHSIRLWVQNTYMPGLPVLVRVELWNAAGERDWGVWDIDATLSSDQGVSLSTNRIALHNGLGSALVTFTGGGDFNLLATIGSVQTNRPLQSVALAPQTMAGGTLPAGTTVWSGVIRVTNDVTVPSGSTLVILSNTLVLIDGVTSGATANDIFVAGTISSQGTEQYPVTITCSISNRNWGQIRHNTAQPSTYTYTTIMKGGRGTGEGHTSTAALIRPTASRITFESCNLSDVTTNGSLVGIGKIMQTFSGSDITFNDCLMTRARSGPEIEGTTLMLTNSYILDMSGPDDADGIYLHAGGPMRITHCVISGGDDDAIDTLSAVMTIDNTIIRNYCDKAVSVLDGQVDLDKTLIVDDTNGVSSKSQSNNGRATVNIDHSTIAVATNGIAVINKGGQTGVIGIYRVTNSIIRAFYSVVTDYSPTNYYLGYCNLNSSFSGQGNTPANNAALAAVVLSGAGMSTNNPLFVDQNADDYRLQPYSPCIDAGSPNSPPDPDGSPIDIGLYTFVPPAPMLTNALATSPFQFTLNAYSNRNYVVEFSTNPPAWTALQTNFQSSESLVVQDNSTADSPVRFYRAHLAQ